MTHALAIGRSALHHFALGAFLIAAFDLSAARMGGAVAGLGPLFVALGLVGLLQPALRRVLREAGLDLGRQGPRMAALALSAALLGALPSILAAAAPAVALAINGGGQGLVIGVGLAIALLPASLVGPSLAAPRAASAQLGALLGLGLAAIAPVSLPAAWLSATLGTPRDRPPLTQSRGALPRALLLGLGLGLLGALLSGLRASLLPDRAGAGAALLLALAGALFGQRLRDLGRSALLLAVLSGGSWLLLDLAGGWLPLWVAPAVGDPTRAAVILTAPALLAALALGLGIGAVAARGPAAPYGLLLGAALIPALAPAHLLLAALLLAGLVLFFEGARGTQALATLALAGLGALWSQRAPLPDDLLAIGQHRLLRASTARAEDASIRAAQRDLVHQLDAQLTQSLRAPEADRRGAPDWTLELDGLLASSTGRLAEAEALAGHLGPLLAPRADRVLLLGDDLGLALQSAVTHPQVGAIVSAMPAGASLRVMAAEDEALRAAALDPRVHLTPLPPAPALLGIGAVDLLIATSRGPWTGGAAIAPDAALLDAAAAHLSDEGTFVLCVHTPLLDEGALPAIVAAFAERFPHFTLWLPPTGIDSLLLIATPGPPSLAEFLARAKVVADPLDRLGFPNGAILAGFAIAGPAVVDRWPNTAELPDPRRLSAAIAAAPRLHVAALQGRLGTPAEIWDLTAADAEVATLSTRIQGRDRLLAMLQDAAQGHLDQVFAAANSLVSGPSPDPANQRALDALIEPQMIQATAALARARQPGADGRAWEEAQRLATTARALSPQSIGPLLILGEVALAQSNFSRATASFEEVLRLDPQSPVAYFGLARIARARRDPDAAIGFLQQATTAGPQDWRAWQNLGVFYLEQARPAEARPALERALALAPKDEPAPALALTEAHLALGTPTDAMVYGERAIVMGGGPYAYYLRGRCNFDLRRYPEAEEDFRRAVLDDPSLIEARGAIGQLRAMEGDWEAAAEAFRAVLSRDPNNAAARENLNRVEARRSAAQRKTEGRQTPGAPR